MGKYDADYRPLQKPGYAEIVTAKREPVLRWMSDIHPEPVHWLWTYRIALGKLSLMAGNPGVGKSTVAFDFAAKVSRGVPWPDRPDELNPEGGVIIMSAEDNPEDTIRPRLDAANANCERIAILDGTQRVDKDGNIGLAPWSATDDLDMLEIAIKQVGRCRLVIVDPITSYLGKTDSHKNAEVRAVLAPLSTLAAKHRIAILAITHHNKQVQGPAIIKTMGSMAFNAAARAVWAFCKDPKTRGRCFMLQVKNNLAPEQLGLAYSVVKDDSRDCGRIVWETTQVDITADEALQAEAEAGNDMSELIRAKDFLKTALMLGQKKAKTVIHDAKDAEDICERTLRRAKREIGIKSRKVYDDGWYWELPSNGQSVSDEPNF